jgi:SAM-dependent methyltransferase
VTALLNERPQKARARFFAQIQPFLRDFSAAHLEQIAKGMTSNKVQNPLEQKWYKSIEAGNPDFSIYNSELYLAEAWACWAIYSRKYLKWVAASRARLFPGVTGVADLGCGTGITTAALAHVFPKAKVSGTQVAGTTQFKIAKLVEQESRSNFDIVGHTTEIKHRVNLVFASEYFEHFFEPVEHLKECLTALNLPETLIIANTFSAPSSGHFPLYKIGGKLIKNKQTSRHFHKALKDFGYESVKTDAWNNRPRIWKRI